MVKSQDLRKQLEDQFVLDALDTLVPSASIMADNLKSVMSKLTSIGVLANGTAALGEPYGRLKERKDSTTWGYGFPRSSPLQFRTISNHRSRLNLIPRISVENIQVEDPREPKTHPYVAWNICLEILCADEDHILARWHFDLSNPGQNSPTAHLQYGGHISDQTFDLTKLREPRWHFHLMDAPLLAEVVVANFYRDEWEALREDPTWCAAIRTSQRLCYGPYLHAISRAHTSGTTYLSELWDDRWH